MKHPIFHPEEEARVGPHASDRSAANQDCTVKIVWDLEGDLQRYTIELECGYRTVVLEESLVKRWARSDWRALKCSWYGETKQIWQPPARRLPARRPTEWKQFKESKQ